MNKLVSEANFLQINRQLHKISETLNLNPEALILINNLNVHNCWTSLSNLIIENLNLARDRDRPSLIIQLCLLRFSWIV